MSEGSGRTEERLSRDEISARTRLLLLDAARTIFLKTGYQGTKLDDVAAAAGFTKGALYWHFPNKQALFLALISDAITTNLGVLDSFLAMGERDPPALKQALGEWIDGIDDRETLPTFGVELEIESRVDPSFRAIHQQLIAGHENALAKFLTRYFELIGETPRMPPAEMAPILITIFKGFALCRQNRVGEAVNSAPAVKILLGLSESA